MVGRPTCFSTASITYCPAGAGAGKARKGGEMLCRMSSTEFRETAQARE
jgi:hypothetical protein